MSGIRPIHFFRKVTGMSNEQDLDTAEPTPPPGEELAPDAEAPTAAPASEELTDEQLATISGGMGVQPPPMTVQPPTS
jgi:bacteriocin-like protein